MFRRDSSLLAFFLFVGQDGSYGSQHWEGVLAYAFGKGLVGGYQAYLVNLVDVRGNCCWFVVTSRAGFRWRWEEFGWFYFLSKLIPAETLGGIRFEGH